MAAENKHESAYPRPGYELRTGSSSTHYQHTDGLTKEEVFIKAAMQGILSNPEIVKHHARPGIRISHKEIAALAHQVGTRTLELITEVNQAKAKL